MKQGFLRKLNMLATVFEFFNIKKHLKHSWLLFSFVPFLVVLIGISVEEGLNLDMPINKSTREYLFFVTAPVNLLGIGIFIYSLVKDHQGFFASSFFHKLFLYFLLCATVVNSGWLLWEQVDAFGCRTLLCGLVILFPFGIMVIISSLLLVYSVVLFGRIRKYESANPNPYV